MICNCVLSIQSPTLFYYEEIRDRAYINKDKDIYSRRGAKSAKRITGIRRSDFSRELLMFATKVAPTENKSQRSLRLREINKMS